jgi:hypothetical protein
MAKNEKPESKDSIAAYLAELGLPNTVEEYVALNWCGDKTLADLEGEELAEILRLIEKGELICRTKMPTKRVQ